MDIDLNNIPLIRLYEFLKEDHPDLCELIKYEETEIEGEMETRFFIEFNENRFEFSCQEQQIDYGTMDYYASISLYPNPEAAFQQFAEMAKAILNDEKVSVSWWWTEGEEMGDLMDASEVEFHDFLWEEAPNATIRSWSGKLDKKLK